MNKQYRYLHLNPRDEQIEILERTTPSESLRPHIQKAYSFIVGEGKIEDEASSESVVPRIFELANYFAIEGARKVIPSLPEALITSSEDAKRILPAVKELRRELFSKEDPPFPNDPARAVDWLENEGEKEESPFLRSIKQAKKMIAELEKGTLKKLRGLTGLNWMLRMEEPGELPYPLKVKGKFTGTMGTLVSLRVWPGTPLARLEEETKRLSEETRFSHHSLVLYVLTGLRPVSMKFTFISAIKWVKSGRRKTVYLTIHRPLSKRETEGLFHEVKKEFGREDKAFLNEKHLFLYDLVKSRGGPPRMKKMEFWKEIRKACNIKYPNWFSNPNSVRIVYGRIMKRVQEAPKALSPDMESRFWRKRGYRKK